ncbi:hypothetical protein ACHAXS_010029 [Conticribra weissflogii]
MLSRNQQRQRRRSFLLRRPTPSSSTSHSYCHPSSTSSNGTSSASSLKDAGQTPRRDGEEGRPGGRRRGGKLFVASETMKWMRFELENLPLPATLASAAIAWMGSEDVVDSFAEAGYFRRGAKDGREGGGGGDDGADSGLYLALEGFRLTPLQTKRERKTQFEGALRELIAVGNREMLHSWEEAKLASSEVFVFARVDLSASGVVVADAHPKVNENVNENVNVNENENETIGQRSRGLGPATATTQILDLTSPKPKSTPKLHSTPTKSHQSQRTPPHKRASASTASVKSPTPKQRNLMQPQMQTQTKPHSTSKLSLAAYQKILQKELGLEKFIRIFKRAVSLSSRPSIADRTSDELDKLDRRITALESQRRSTLRDEAVISEYQTRKKEEEAKLAASKLLRPLTSDEQYLVQKALYAIGPPDDVLASLDADSVQRASMQTLQPGRWINDEIINYFLKNCLAKRDELLCSTQPGRKRSHFFNSYFVQTMFDDKNVNPAKRGKYNYNNVKRWSKKVPGKDIFNLKYVVCPINLDNMHWTSAVMFMEERKIRYYDSMGGTEWTKLEGLLQYVKDEHKAKKGKELEGWEEWELLGCPDNIPRQLNGEWCG